VQPADDRSASDVHLTLSLTHDCNLRCSYCYAGAKVRRHMPYELGLRAIDRAIERTRRRLHVVYFGGEPLLRWRTLVALTEQARRRAGAAEIEARFAVTTNGTLLTPARAAFLAKHEFVTAISCDGTREANDLYRLDAHGRGSHARVTAGVRHALDAGLRVRAILVLDPATLAWLPDSVASLAAIGVRDFVLNPNWGARFDEPAVRARWTTAYEALGALYVDAYRSGAPLWISALDTKVQSHIKGSYLAHERCDLGRRDLVVAPSGRLYPCDRMIGDDDGAHAIGHLDDGVEAAALQAVVEPASTLPDACQSCAIVHRCRNRCACTNLALTGTLDAPSETLCFHEQLSIRVADRAAELLFAEQNEAFVRRHYRSELTSLRRSKHVAPAPEDR
jgi:uncharacterized protein